MCNRWFSYKLGESMTIEKEIIDRLLADYRKPEDLTGENGVLRS